MPGEIIVSLGMGMTFVPMSSTALVGVDPHDAGVASVLVNATQQVGGSLGTALLNTVAASAAASYLAGHLHRAGAVAAAPVHGYTTGFTVSAALLLLAAVVAGGLVRTARGEVGLEPGGEPAPTTGPAAGFAPARAPEPAVPGDREPAFVPALVSDTR